MSLNKVMLIGRLGRDPETKQTPNTTVCKFSVATDDGTKEKPETTWHNITCFGKLADVCARYLLKGRSVYVEGRIQISKYEKDGVQKTSIDIIAQSVQFLSDNKPQEKEVEDNSLFGGTSYNTKPANTSQPTALDIPF